jgi:hypothetical protein
LLYYLGKFLHFQWVWSTIVISDVSPGVVLPLLRLWFAKVKLNFHKLMYAGCKKRKSCEAALALDVDLSSWNYLMRY